MTKSTYSCPYIRKGSSGDWSYAVTKFNIGVFRSPSSDSDSEHSIYFPAEDPSSGLSLTSNSEELPSSTMSNDRMSALEQAFSDSQARELHTQKQIDLMFQQLQQLIVQQSTTPPKTRNPISDSVSSTPTRRAPPPALPNEFDGDRSKGPAFLRSCQTYVRLCPNSFSDDQTKIIWSLSYMKAGRAANTVGPMGPENHTLV